jgi:hypothetical protein
MWCFFLLLNDSVNKWFCQFMMRLLCCRPAPVARTKRAFARGQGANHVPTGTRTTNKPGQRLRPRDKPALTGTRTTEYRLVHFLYFVLSIRVDSRYSRFTMSVLLVYLRLIVFAFFAG